MINAGLASKDGKSGQVGVNMVTPERIPMLFDEDGSFFRSCLKSRDQVLGTEDPEIGGKDVL